MNSHNYDLDILTLFFEDVGQLKIVSGKSDYLPLTRRIRRHVILSSLLCQNPKETFNKVFITLSKTTEKFETQCKPQGQHKLDIIKLGMEIEEFLDNPHIDVTPYLASILNDLNRIKSKKEIKRLEQLGWRCFYLLSLIPPDTRLGYPNIKYSIDARKHLNMISTEAEEAKVRLIEGTLRYVINIANSFVGQGVPYLDLVQEGFTGLIRATESYDERSGHFQQYASIWIRQRIIRYIADSGKLIRTPVHFDEFVIKVDEKVKEFERINGFHPENHDIENIVTDIMHDRNKEHPVSKSRIYSQLKLYNIASAKFYSLERCTFRNKRNGLFDLEFEDFLIADDDIEETVKQAITNPILRDLLDDLMEKFPVRYRKMLDMRYGFRDGNEHTLNEVGVSFGITRERVRQILSDSMGYLQNPISTRKFEQISVISSYDFLGGSNRFCNPQSNQHLNLLEAGLDSLSPDFEALYPVKDKDEIHSLIRKYIERGRRGLFTQWRKGGMVVLFRQILEEIGKPVHYSVVHKKAITRVQVNINLTKQHTYSKLFYRSNIFRAYSGGIFGLVIWEKERISNGEVPIFPYCPKPLQTTPTYPNAFFDSIMFGRDQLLVNSLTVEQFWVRMLGWAGYNEVHNRGVQEAFDAWYAAGLIGYYHFYNSKDSIIKLMLPNDLSIKEIRFHCLSKLCQRVIKMSELLFTLTYIGRPSISSIQRVLFGEESMDYDVPTRLNLLASFGAVRAYGEEWRLTDIGRSILDTYPSLELPEIDEKEEIDIVSEELLLELDYLDIDLNSK